jgi:hypothetical protein
MKEKSKVRKKQKKNRIFKVKKGSFFLWVLEKTKRVWGNFILF